MLVLGQMVFLKVTFCNKSSMFKEWYVTRFVPAGRNKFFPTIFILTNVVYNYQPVLDFGTQYNTLGTRIYNLKDL